jgi:hypothetical protein
MTLLPDRRMPADRAATNAHYGNLDKRKMNDTHAEHPVDCSSGPGSLVIEPGGTMKTSLRYFLAALLISGLFGCAGRDFVRPNPEDYTLGQTTYAQVAQRMGEPRTTSDILKNGKNVKAISYAYASKGGEPLEADVIPARVQAYYFYNDALVGRAFISSFKTDNTNFDEKRIESIQKGQSTHADVVALLGPPTASFIAPMVKETSDEAIGYTYQAIRGGLFRGLKAHMKTLRISFDDNGRISDVEFTSSDNE